ncbi:hypothetical protein [Dyadobacter sp. CY326]|uniref:hypothetical protein n=1 Tax=Dyadobacter sp. CY326 TaxID=2907300 RepID=UPI001F379C73|nr:hypothetical protein [Dyadobacter sp. CY326]MCE7065251.1 hypothetical protein [Dyadobacter sp. CY326]
MYPQSSTVSIFSSFKNLTSIFSFSSYSLQMLTLVQGFLQFGAGGDYKKVASALAPEIKYLE